MRLKIALAFLFVGMLIWVTPVKAETTTEVQNGRVVAVEGNHVVIQMSNGETKAFDVPDGFTVNVDGKDIPVKELKPGTMLSKTITTTTEPKTVHTTEIKKGRVWARQGNMVIIQGADGKNRQYTNVPDWIKFEHNGKEVSVYDLKVGWNVSATIVSETQSQVVTTTPSPVTGSTPAPPPAPSVPSTGSAGPTDSTQATPATPEKMEEAPQKKLPETAANYGFILLAGLSLIAVSWKLR
jgi:hypothetical protein